MAGTSQSMTADPPTHDHSPGRSHPRWATHDGPPSVDSRPSRPRWATPRQNRPDLHRDPRPDMQPGRGQVPFSPTYHERNVVLHSVSVAHRPLKRPADGRQAVIVGVTVRYDIYIYIYICIYTSYNDPSEVPGQRNTTTTQEV